MSVPILDIVDVHAAYGRIEVLRGVNLRIPKGAVVALLGPNGAGKSTLLKVISGQMQQTSGDIHMAGVHVTGAKPEAVCHWAFEMAAARPDDTLDDLFPGTGAVTRAWHSWRLKFALPDDPPARRTAT